MGEINDGGPAFPQVETEVRTDEYGRSYGDVTSCGGMSLRDYFAAVALPECIRIASRPEVRRLDPIPWQHPASEAAYAIADAMLSQRAK